MPVCPKTSQFCEKISEVPSQIKNSKVGSAITKYINFPMNALDRLTTPLSQKMVSLGIRMGGERYERHCQTAAMNLANDAIEGINDAIDTPVIVIENLESKADKTEKGFVRRNLNRMGDGIYSASNWINQKGEKLDESSWMVVRGFGKTIQMASYPVAAGSYVPSALSHVGEKVAEKPWAKMDANDPRRLIAEHIYSPLIANIDRAVMEKEVRFGANAAAAYAAFAGLSQACSMAQVYSAAQTTVAAGQQTAGFTSATSKGLHGALAANGFAWVGMPVLSKGLGMMTNDNEAQVGRIKDAIIAKNPQLVAVLQKIQGLSEEAAKNTLSFVVGHALDRYAGFLNFLGSDAKTIEALSKFPVIHS